MNEKRELNPYEGIWVSNEKRKKLWTKNLTPEKQFFGDFKGEYRFFDPRRSKLAAAIYNNVQPIPLKKKDKVLYLGAAHGYTPSFISDIVGKEGLVICIDFAPRVVRELYLICKERENMLPLLADANKPETYKEFIPEVDCIYQDIAQKNQIEIVKKNSQFLKRKGYIFLALKTRSIDVTKNPKTIYEEAQREIRKDFKILAMKSLNPWEKDHYFIVAQKY